MKCTCYITVLVALISRAAIAGPASILAEPATAEALPGDAMSILFRISQAEPTPVFGYSLDIDVLAGPGSSGAIVVDIDFTNFFDEQNLITAGGGTRDALASEIVANTSGVFISTNTDDLSSIIPVEGVNDVLAQVYFDISTDASGVFAIELGRASVLSDANGLPIEFDFTPASITVVPEPSTLFLALLGIGILARRQRRIASYPWRAARVP